MKTIFTKNYIMEDEKNKENRSEEFNIDQSFETELENDLFTRSKRYDTLLTAKFEVPELPYAYFALEPYIDRTTMEIHHDKHHAAYVTNLNKALQGLNETPSSLEEIIKKISKYPVDVRNNAGGHYNHSLFWKLMKTKGEGQPIGTLSGAIAGTFGSFDNFKAKFTDVATKHFGSGWAWLVLQNGKLEIGSTPNQDNPLMDISTFKGIPILCLDVWEHAYYLKYQNRRVEYINGWWNIVNWEEASIRFANANHINY